MKTELVITREKMFIITDKVPELGDIVWQVQNSDLLGEGRYINFFHKVKPHFMPHGEGVVLSLGKKTFPEISLSQKVKTELCEVYGYVDTVEIASLLYELNQEKDESLIYFGASCIKQARNISRVYSYKDMAMLWQFVVEGAKELMLSGGTSVGSFEDYMKQVSPTIRLEVETMIEQPDYEYFYQDPRNDKWCECDKKIYELLTMGKGTPTKRCVSEKPQKIHVKSIL